MLVIFVPGLLCTEEVWGRVNEIRKYYSCQDADVVRFNSLEEMSDSIIDKVEMSSDDVAIIGISMGGYVAIDVAIKLRDRLKKLVLIGTTCNPVNADTIPDRNKAIKLAEKGKMSDIILMSKGVCFFKPKKEWLLIEERMANQVGCEAYIRQQNAIINRKNYSSQIHSISAETLILSGKEDVVIPLRDSIFMSENIPNSKLSYLDECGHLPTMEKGEETFNLVSKFLG